MGDPRQWAQPMGRLSERGKGARRRHVELRPGSAASTCIVAAVMEGMIRVPFGAV